MLFTRYTRRPACAVGYLSATAGLLALVTACAQRDTSPTAPALPQAAAPQMVVGANVTVIPGLGPPGAGLTRAADINDAGQVVGWSLDWSANRHAFLWTPKGGTQDLGTLGGPTAEATAINAAGHVVGFSETADRQTHAFLWTPARGMQDLGTVGTMGSIARDINNRGEVVGYALAQVGSVFELRALLWTADQVLVELPTLGSRQTAALSINNAGRVVIDVVTAPGEEHPFLWSEQQGMLDLGGLPGEVTEGVAINERGQVVGVAIRQPDARPFLWERQDGITELGAVGGPEFGTAADINDAGQVVGVATTTGHAFVWSPTNGMDDLYPATGMTEARAINNRGQVVGGNVVATLRFGSANRASPARLEGGRHQ